MSRSRSRIQVALPSILPLLAFLVVGCGEQKARAGPVEDPNAAARAEEQRKAVATMKIDLDQTMQAVRSLEEAFSKAQYQDISSHADKIVELAQDIRRQTINIPSSDAEVIRLLVDRMEHAAHEVSEAGAAKRHEDAHHAFEGLQAEIKSLQERVNRM